MKFLNLLLNGFGCVSEVRIMDSACLRWRAMPVSILFVDIL